MSVITLSTKQEEIASFSNGALLVKASAGSGKTRVLTERIKRLTKLSKRKILAITFTNKACEEIKDRLQDLDDINEKLFVGTFHSFCNYVLEKHGNVIGFSQLPQVFSEDSDRLKIIEEVISTIPMFKESYELKNERDRNSFKYACLESISKIKRDVILDSELNQVINDEEIILLYLNYKNYLKSLNAIDFDDLLLEVYKLFISYPNIAALYRRNYEFVCVDEAQDMNKAQYMVLKALIGNESPNIMLVGDEKQCIYGFIGSNSKFMMENFVNDYKPTIFELKENFRSSIKVLEYANKIIPDSTELKDTVNTGICELHEFCNQYDEAIYVVEKIKELISLKSHPEIEGDITYNKISVLGRTKYVLQAVEEELIKEKIPYFYKNTQRTFELESYFGNVFELALKVKINPIDFLHFSELKNILCNESNDNSLQEISSSLDNTFEKKLIELIIDLKEDGSNFIKVIQEIKKEIPNISYFDDSEKVLAFSDFVLIEKAWYKYAKTTNNKSLAAFHNSISLGQTSNFEEKQGVSLSTVHTMKGQENDIVFLIGMDDLTFPDYRALTGAQLQQEKNDLYVAITRAKRFLFISYPMERQMPWGAVYHREKSRLLPD